MTPRRGALSRRKHSRAGSGVKRFRAEAKSGVDWLHGGARKPHAARARSVKAFEMFV